MQLETEKVEIISLSLAGCKGMVKGEKYGDCYIIEFTYVPNNYFRLPCTQVIDKKHIEVI